MGWSWQLHSDGGVRDPDATTQPAAGFPTQADAESWVGEVWHDLLDAGVDSVSLYEDGRLVYGGMSLHPLE